MGSVLVLVARALQSFRFQLNFRTFDDCFQVEVSGRTAQVKLKRERLAGRGWGWG